MDARRKAMAKAFGKLDELSHQMRLGHLRAAMAPPQDVHTPEQPQGSEQPVEAGGVAPEDMDKLAEMYGSLKRPPKK